MMYLFRILFLLIVVPFAARSQEKEKFQLFNEAVASVNIMPLSKTPNLIGGGAGIYHRFLSGKSFQIITGLEYNYTSAFTQIDQKFGSIEDVTVKWNNVGVPVIVRHNFILGNSKTSLFIELGAYADISLYTVMTGRNNYWTPQGQNTSPYRQVTSGSDPDVGLLGGIGVQFPVKDIAMFIRPSYRFGLLSINSDHSVAHKQFAQFSLGVIW